MHISPNTLSKVADLIFKILLSVNFIGFILYFVYTFKILFNKFNSINFKMHATWECKYHMVFMI